MSGDHRLPLPIVAPPILADHHFEGRPVLPSVVALQALARLVRERAPSIPVHDSLQARFLRFLPLAPDGDPIEIDAHAELEEHEQGTLTASLVTVTTLGQTKITRAKEHLRVTFGRSTTPPSRAPEPPRGDAAFSVSAERLYRELVPFGPAFHNAHDPITLTPAGATARLAAPASPALDGPLGSPFPLDAAMHVACAWGQRYAGVVAYPVGYERRWVLQPTAPDGLYHCVVIACNDATATLRFDLWITDPHGTPREVVLGLQMEDLSRGRLKVPGWVRLRRWADREA
jgi:hypothetical protein